MNQETYFPCSRQIEILDQHENANEIPPYVHYLVRFENAYGGESVGVVIEPNSKGVEEVYTNQKFPVASMLPGQSENDELLLNLFRTWVLTPPMFTQVTVRQQPDKFYTLSFNNQHWNFHSRSKNLSYVKGKIRDLAKSRDVKVTWEV
jgi:hypothetical protein